MSASRVRMAGAPPGQLNEGSCRPTINGPSFRVMGWTIASIFVILLRNISYFQPDLRVDVDSAPAYEFVLALGVVADGERRAAYALGAQWFAAVRRVCPASLLRAVGELSGGSDMIWAHLLTLAYDLPPPRTPRALVQQVGDIDPIELRRRLFGYYVRYFRRATPPDVIAAAAAGDRRAARRFLETSYPHHQAWQ